MKLKNHYSSDEFECSSDIDKRRMTWKDPIALFRNGSNASIGKNKKIIGCATHARVSSSPSRNDVCGDDDHENDHSTNDSENDESFSSFLSSSIGQNISNSFDWALDTTTMQPCRNPFENYCFPIDTPTARKQTVVVRHSQKGEEDSSDEERGTLVADDEHGTDEEDGEVLRPYVPFTLPLYCEYCGSPSIENCHNFDPKCQRPGTFFPKAKPPFGPSVLLNPI